MKKIAYVMKSSLKLTGEFMCGFIGLLQKNSFIENGTIFNMLECLNHRGPDDTCYSIVNKNNKICQYPNISDCEEKYKIGMGFKRLSIRDLSLNGRQPMIDDSNKIAILFNGEIYNTLELLPMLTEVQLKSNSDTEIILNLYLKYGFNKMVKILNGMFSIAIFDLNKKHLYLARDRIGIKPLYYTYNQELFMFSSELKSFKYNALFNKELNYYALEEFFVFGDPLEDLLMKNVFEVIPGEYIELDFSCNGFSIKKHKYFDLNNFERPNAVKYDQDFYLEEFKRVLIDCISRQVVSDVSIGCQLSGGIDSSIITYYGAKENVNKVISILQDNEYSEEEYIKIVLKEIPDLKSYYFNLNDDYFVDNLEKSIIHYENILTYHNVIAIMGMAKKARENMTVLLSGEGADELFGGYTWFEDGFYVDKYFNGKISSIPNVRGIENAKTYAEFAVMSTDTIDTSVSKKMFISKINYEGIKKRRVNFFNNFKGNSFEKHIKYEMSTRLRNLLLRQDKAMMAFSIENRVPFLDNKMIDFAFSLPQNLLIGDEKPTGKKILKLCSEKIFGNDFTYRRKMGLPIPIHKFMLNKRFRSYFYDVILPQIKNRGIMNAAEIQRQFDSIDSNANRWNFAPLWKAISFEIWCKNFID